MVVIIVIPARYDSTRLPGKPLLNILGKPMIQHVYERAVVVQNIKSVFVATDDDRIKDSVEGFGGSCLLTSRNHSTGTDRLVEVMRNHYADIYVNLQGDEPLIRPTDVQLLVDGMIADRESSVGTLCHLIDKSEAENHNVVKVVTDCFGYALYFSRSVIPYPRETPVVYAYRRSVLENYSNLPASMLESAEKLEQLRLLEAGIRIKTFRVNRTGPGVDTPQCLENVEFIMRTKI